LKKCSINKLFGQRFEEEIVKISTGIHKKGCVKDYGKICEYRQVEN
jgi:hypothetical protein